MRTIHLKPTGKGPSGTASIDDDLFDWASKYQWRLRPDGYATRGKGRVFMHRLIAMAGPDEQVHHRNGNKTDNRRENLEVMTLREHNRLHWKNRGPRSTGFRGVYGGIGKSKNFVAHLLSGDDRIHLGTFATAEEAAACWNDAARKQWGDGVYQNPVSCSYTPITMASKGPNAGRRFKGITLCKQTGKWRAVATIAPGKRLPLGRFNTEEEAAKAYNEAILKYRGPGHFLNDV